MLPIKSMYIVTLTSNFDCIYLCLFYFWWVGEIKCIYSTYMTPHKIEIIMHVQNTCTIYKSQKIFSPKQLSANMKDSYMIKKVKQNWIVI